MGVVRTTYLIDEQGVIIKANDKVKAAEDPENMLNSTEWSISHYMRYSICKITKENKNVQRNETKKAGNN